MTRRRRRRRDRFRVNLTGDAGLLGPFSKRRLGYPAAQYWEKADWNSSPKSGAESRPSRREDESRARG